MRIKLVVAPAKPEAPATCSGCPHKTADTPEGNRTSHLDSPARVGQRETLSKALGFVSVATLLSPSIRLK